MKLAKVILVHKKDDINDINNYRPVSILLTSPKAFEKLIALRLVNYFEKYQYFTQFQHGYRKGKSTTTGMSELVNKIMEILDDIEKAELLSCDLY